MFILSATGTKKNFLLARWFGYSSESNISKTIPVSWTILINIDEIKQISLFYTSSAKQVKYP